MAEELVDIRTRVLGARAAQADLLETGAAAEEMGAEIEAAGVAMERTARRSFLMNQALFTGRRLMYGTTLAFIGAGVFALKFGFDYATSMQEARVALQGFLGSQTAVNKELNFLFDFSKHTPFLFKDITSAARVLMAFGIPVKQTNQTIHSIVDALSAVGKTTPGALNRVAVALGHMSNVGHVTGAILLQLARDGVPVYNAFHKELGLTADQIHNIGKLGIPTGVALNAINKYIESSPKFMNQAYKQSTQTWHGLMTTFKDDLGQIVGEGIHGPLIRTQHWLKTAVIPQMDILSQVMRDKGFFALVKAFDSSVHAGGFLYHTFVFLTDAARDAWSVFKNILVPVLRDDAYFALLLLSPVIYGVALGLHLMAHHGAILKPLLVTLGALWLINKARVEALAFWTGIMALRTKLLATYTEWLILEEKAIAFTMWAYQAVLKAVVAAQTLMEAGMVLLADETLYYALVLEQTAIPAVAAFTAALLADPATWVVVGVIALGVALAELVIHWNEVTAAAHRFTDWAEKHWQLLSILAAGPLAPVAAVGIGGLDVGKFALKHLATGGTTGGGMYTVGEHGQENVYLPPGSQVTPVKQMDVPNGGWGVPDYVTVHTTLVVDGRELAEMVSKHKLDRKGHR